MSNDLKQVDHINKQYNNIYLRLYKYMNYDVVVRCISIRMDPLLTLSELTGNLCRDGLEKIARFLTNSTEGKKKFM